MCDQQDPLTFTTEVSPLGLRTSRRGGRGGGGVDSNEGERTYVHKRKGARLYPGEVNCTVHTMN